jgi:hypothetical protein
MMSYIVILMSFQTIFSINYGLRYLFQVVQTQTMHDSSF